MRKIYRNFIDKQTAIECLSNTSQNRHSLLKTDNALVKRIIEKLKEDFEFNVKEQSYWLTERRGSGHVWHKDTGTSNHMVWCEVGVSILLSEQDDFKGGDTWYGDDEKGTNATKSKRKPYDLVAHTSDEWHKVDSHEGQRNVFLMFI